jgi:hypothetical protein
VAGRATGRCEGQTSRALKRSCDRRPGFRRRRCRSRRRPEA